MLSGLKFHVSRFGLARGVVTDSSPPQPWAGLGEAGLVIDEVSAGQGDRQLVDRTSLLKNVEPYRALPSTDPRMAVDLLNRHVRRDLAGGNLIADGA